jgi:pSer/pThr/pTyr-binding forkhead associated (FHA) protein
VRTMPGPLSFDELERRIQTLIEVRLVDLLPGNHTEDMVAHQLAGLVLSTTDLDDADREFPTRYELRVSRADLPEWLARRQLLDELTSVIRTIAGESGFRMAALPVLQVTGEPALRSGEIEIQVLPSENHVAATQSAQPGDPEAGPGLSPVNNAFLIIGGVNVFPLDRSVVNLGRRNDNHVVLDDPRISRYHAQLRAIRGRYVVFDLNSTGGTFVNGQRTKQSVLYPGDVISLAGFSIIFGQDSPPPVTHVTGTEPLKPRPASDRPTAILSRHREDDSQA